MPAVWLTSISVTVAAPRASTRRREPDPSTHEAPKSRATAAKASAVYCLASLRISSAGCISRAVPISSPARQPSSLRDHGRDRPKAYPAVTVRPAKASESMRCRCSPPSSTTRSRAVQPIGVLLVSPGRCRNCALVETTTQDSSSQYGSRRL